MIPFADILAAAQIAQVAVPAAVKLLQALGCAIANCPDEYDGVVLKPADLPDAAGKMRDAKDEALARTRAR